MSSLNLRLPDHIHQHIRELAKEEGISINQLITLAVAEKLSALGAQSYLQKRAARASDEAFDKVMAAVPDTPANVQDEIPEDLKTVFEKP